MASAFAPMRTRRTARPAEPTAPIVDDDPFEGMSPAEQRRTLHIHAVARDRATKRETIRPMMHPRRLARIEAVQAEIAVHVQARDTLPMGNPERAEVVAVIAQLRSRIDALYYGAWKYLDAREELALAGLEFGALETAYWDYIEQGMSSNGMPWSREAILHLTALFAEQHGCMPAWNEFRPDMHLPARSSIEKAFGSMRGLCAALDVERRVSPWRGESRWSVPTRGEATC